MKRTIYQFYCYVCYKQNTNRIPYPLRAINEQIHEIYCPNCKAWVSYKNTNLVPERYKLIHPNEWAIVDQDSPRCQIIYTVKSHQMAVHICNMLNKGTLSVHQLYYELCYGNLTL